MSDVFMARTLTQTATYWAPSGKDGFANAIFAAPVQIPCRWINKTRLAISDKGETVQSTAQVRVGLDLALGGFVAFGNLGSPSGTPSSNGAREIRMLEKIPNMNGTQFTRRAIL